MIGGPITTDATQDDWVITFRMRAKDGRVYQRTIGVNGCATEEAAVRLASATVRPPRATLEGRTHAILDVRVQRFHEWVTGRETPYKALDTMKV